MRSRLALVAAAIPVVALILALPLVNRVEPIVLGLPFVLFWILAWVLATPAFLVAAYWLLRTGSSGPGTPR